jgi:hypothetical protein
MLFDLTHSKSLIGKSRAEIHALLGEPTYSESKPSADRRVTYFRRRIEGPAPFNRFDWFALNRTGCVEPAEPSHFSRSSTAATHLWATLRWATAVLNQANTRMVRQRFLAIF